MRTSRSRPPARPRSPPGRASRPSRRWAPARARHGRRAAEQAGRAADAERRARAERGTDEAEEGERAPRPLYRRAFPAFSRENGGCRRQAASDGRPTLDPPWLPTRLRRSGAVRAAGRSTARSTAASTGEPGCSSAFRCSSSPSASPVHRRSSRRASRRRSTGLRQRTSPATWRSAGRSAPRVARGRRALRAGSPSSSRRTATSSARRRSPPTSQGRGRCGSGTSSRRKPGLSHKTIVVMAHRDDAGTGPGANDNASGTGALVELARTYAPDCGQGPDQASVHPALPLHGRCRRRRARSRRVRGSRARAVECDRGAQPRRDRRQEPPAARCSTGDTPRSPASGLVETVRLELSRRDRLRARPRQRGAGS